MLSDATFLLLALGIAVCALTIGILVGMGYARETVWTEGYMAGVREAIMESESTEAQEWVRLMEPTMYDWGTE